MLADFFPVKCTNRVYVYFCANIYDYTGAHHAVDIVSYLEKDLLWPKISQKIPTQQEIDSDETPLLFSETLLEQILL